MSVSYLADGRAGIEGLALRSLAPSTGRAYHAAWRDWSAFRARSCGEGESEEDCLLAFVWEHYQKGRSKAAMSSALAGISFYARLGGGFDPTRSFVLAKALRGWARLRPAPADTRKPIDRHLLRKLLAVLPGVADSGFEATLFGLAFSCAFFGAFRVGELVAASGRSEDTGLLFSDVEVKVGSVLCRVARSKTDQLGRGRWVSLLAQPGDPVCPVELAAAYSPIRPQGGVQWLLHRNGLPLTRFQFGAVLRRCLVQLGLAAGDYGTHSFRIGAATCAAARGVSDEGIQTLGRWRSKAFRSYVRPDMMCDN